MNNGDRVIIQCDHGDQTENDLCPLRGTKGTILHKFLSNAEELWFTVLFDDLQEEDFLPTELILDTSSSLTIGDIET